MDTQANTISRIKRDLTNREVIVKDGLNSVEGLAVDWMGGRHIKYLYAGQFCMLFYIYIFFKFQNDHIPI